MQSKTGLVILALMGAAIVAFVWLIAKDPHRATLQGPRWWRRWLALGFWFLGLLGVPGCETRREVPLAGDALSANAKSPVRAVSADLPLNLEGTRFDPARQGQVLQEPASAPGLRRVVTVETILDYRTDRLDRRSLSDILQEKRLRTLCYVMRLAHAPPQALLLPLMIHLRLQFLERLMDTGALRGGVGARVAADLLSQVLDQDPDTWHKSDLDREDVLRRLRARAHPKPDAIGGSKGVPRP